MVIPMLFICAELALSGCATSTPAPRVSEQVNVALPVDKGSAKKMEADLGHLFDAIAERHRLVCKVCEPLSEGRSYGGQTNAEKAVALTANFDPSQGRIYYDLRPPADNTKPGLTQEIDAIRAEIQQQLRADFPGLRIVTLTPAKVNALQLVVQMGRRASSYLEHENQEDYKRTLDIVEKVAMDFALTKAHPAMYYTGKLLGPNDYERELTLSVLIAQDPLISIRIDARSEEYIDVQRQVMQELQRRLLDEFGAARISGADSPVPSDAEIY